jgi:RNA recognition motif-containing protein
MPSKSEGQAAITGLNGKTLKGQTLVVNEARVKQDLSKTNQYGGAVKTNIYIGNLSREVTEEDVRHAFEGFGQVASATIIRDRTSGRSRGFGFVEMPNKAEADGAITGLNGKELKGRKVIVNEARPRSEGRRDDGREPSL